MATTRTDIHRAASPDFDPEAYDLLGVFDLNPEWGDGGARMQAINLAVRQGYSFAEAPHPTGQCSHCGAHLRYAALMLHVDSKTLMYIGEQCLDNRFCLSKAEFQDARRRGAARSERGARHRKIEQLCEEHPLLAWLTYTQVLDNDFLADVAEKLGRHGELSDRQIAAAERALLRDTERRDRKVVEDLARPPAPSGEVVVTGVIRTTRCDPSPFAYGRYVFKMLVESDAGWKVWSTLPRALDGAERGTRVTFTADLTPSDDDPAFAFGKRPRRARVIY